MELKYSKHTKHRRFARIAAAGGVLLDGSDRQATKRNRAPFAELGENAEEAAVYVSGIAGAMCL